MINIYKQFNLQDLHFHLRAIAEAAWILLHSIRSTTFVAKQTDYSPCKFPSTRKTSLIILERFSYCLIFGFIIFMYLNIFGGSLAMIFSVLKVFKEI